LNISRLTSGILSVFLGFFLPVLNHGMGMIAGTIQNAGRMIGDNNSFKEHVWPKADIFNFLKHMPWIMWLYFIFMVGLGLYLIKSGFKKTAESGIEKTD
jgi:hypothetical protein